MCDARIRPFPDDTELVCESTDDHTMHHATLRDYAFPGSSTIVRWREADRRTFRGGWPGLCSKTAGCVLPSGHPRDCSL